MTLAQDLERAGLKSAVTTTQGRKIVDGAKLAGALAAMMPGINDRLSKLEDAEPGKSKASTLAAALAATAPRQGG